MRVCESLIQHYTSKKEETMTDLQEAMLTSLCNALEDESKQKRKCTLQRLRQETIDKINNIDGNTDIVFNTIFKPLLQCFSDSAEICRELSINLIMDFIPRLNTLDNYLAYMIKVILKRIGEKEVLESSEEVRLLLISLLHKIVVKSGTSLFPYNDDISKIICRSLEDPYPQIKIECFECLMSLTEAIPKQFHVQSACYIASLASAMTHKHSKVRLNAIMAIGAVIQYGTNGLVDKVVSPLAERLYDSNPAVRRTVVLIAGQLLRELPDRYSQFARILPLVLTGLDDEAIEVREEAQQQWISAGKQYLNENEEEFKNKINYMSDDFPQYCRLAGERPTLGCKALVEREAGKLFPAAVRELHEWTLAVQMQAASLIYQLVRHLEIRSVQHIHRLWPELSLLCAQSDLSMQLQTKVEEVAKLLGSFVTCSVLLSVGLSQPELTLGQLRCLACALRGIPVLVEPELNTLAVALSTTVSTSVQSSYQHYMLQCVSEVIRAAREGQTILNNDPCKESVSFALFSTILVAQGLEDAQLISQANELQNSLAALTGLKTSELYVQHGQRILESLRKNVAVWTDVCPDKSKFCALVNGAGTGIGHLLELVAEILVKWIEKAATGKSLADLVRVAQPLMSWKFLQECQVDPKPFINKMLISAIVPGLVWSAGRVAEVKRSQALVLLLITIAEPLPNDIVIPLAQNLLPLLVGTLEETNKTIRLHACHAITLLGPIWGPNLSAQQVLKTCQMLGGRLDDISAEVRIQALTALQKLLLSLPEHHESLASPVSLQDIQKSLLIHLDDSEPTFREAVLDALKKLGHIGTIQLLELLKCAKKNFRNQDECLSLQCYLENLIKTSTAT